MLRGVGQYLVFCLHYAAHGDITLSLLIQLPFELSSLSHLASEGLVEIPVFQIDDYTDRQLKAVG